MISYEKIVWNASEKKDIDAINDYSYAIKKNHEYPQAFMERGIRYSKIGKYRESIIDLTTAIQKKNELYYPRCFLERGKTYLRLKKYKEAKSDFSKMYRLNNISSEGIEKALLYRSIANIFLKKPCIDLNRFEYDLMNAKFCISEIYIANERRYLIGLNYSLKKNYELAISYFSNIISEDPEFFKRNIEYFDLIPIDMKLLFKVELNI